MALTLLSTAREAVGAAFLLAPVFTSKVGLMSISASAILPTRMAGTRDLVLGALTFYAARQARLAAKTRDNHGIKPGTAAAAAATTTTTTSLLNSDSSNNSNNNASAAAVQSNLNMRYVLLANIAVDALDVLACVWCLEEGSLGLEGALTMGIGASSLLGLGVYALKKFPSVG